MDLKEKTRLLRQIVASGESDRYGLCPFCDVLIEKMPRGCNTMLCGRNARDKAFIGSSQGRGCGMEFKWENRIRAETFLPSWSCRKLLYQWQQSQEREDFNEWRFHHGTIPCSICLSVFLISGTIIGPVLIHSGVNYPSGPIRDCDPVTCETIGGSLTAAGCLFFVGSLLTLCCPPPENQMRWRLRNTKITCSLCLFFSLMASTVIGPLLINSGINSPSGPIPDCDPVTCEAVGGTLTAVGGLLCIISAVTFPHCIDRFD